MSTFFAETGICGWCGKRDAPFLCACKRISFCHKACLKAGWPEHRLSCSKAKSSASDLSNGDIVKIQGLQSEQGKKMNGILAEVISKDETTGRFNVLYTAEAFLIKSAAVKPDNLKLDLAVGEAASISAAKRIGSRSEEEERMQNEFVKRSVDLARILPSLSGMEIVRRLNDNDMDMAQALVRPGTPDLTIPKQLELLENGLIDACLRQFKYPLSIDEDWDRESMIIPLIAINILGNALFVGASTQSFLPRLRPYQVEACQKLGPTILLCTTKKRRLFGRTELWCEVQSVFTALVGNCLLAEGAASSILLRTLDVNISSALLEHVIFTLTVDFRLFLRKRMAARELEKKIDRGAKCAAVPVLMELTDLQSVTEATVRRIGLTLIPAGAGANAGKPFASCFLEIAAKVALEEIKSGQVHRGGLMIEELQYTYSMLLKSPALVPLLGEFDHEFAHLETPGAVERWVEKRLTGVGVL
jgi:hypothetical protein